MLRQNVGRIDHISFLVQWENFEPCTRRLERALQIKFLTIDRADLQIRIAYDCDAGLQIIAPMSKDSPLWNRLQDKGEGCSSLVFGVDDLEGAKARALSAGIATGPELGPQGDEPWASKFQEIREVVLGEVFGIGLLLGRLVPSGPAAKLDNTKLTQNIQRIDHISYLVRQENFDTCVVQLERGLGIKLLRNRRDDLQVLIAIDWDSGLEIVAPTSPDCFLWPLLQEKGEGCAASVVFGVDDLAAAESRARSAGYATGPEWGSRGDEEWASRFSTLRELKLEEAFGIRLVLGHIVPRQ